MTTTEAISIVLRAAKANGAEDTALERVRELLALAANGEHNPDWTRGWDAGRAEGLRDAAEREELKGKLL